MFQGMRVGYCVLWNVSSLVVCGYRSVGLLSEEGSGLPWDGGWVRTCGADV